MVCTSVGLCERSVGGWSACDCVSPSYQYAHNLCCPMRCSLLGQVKGLTACSDSILRVPRLQLAVEEGTGREGRGGEGRGLEGREV